MIIVIVSAAGLSFFNPGPADAIFSLEVAVPVSSLQPGPVPDAFPPEVPAAIGPGDTRWSSRAGPDLRVGRSWVLPPGARATVPASAFGPRDDGATARYLVRADGADAGVVRTFMRCDFNLDGFVDGIDADRFQASFEGGMPQADFNLDGFVDGIDADLWNNAFGGPAAR